MVTAASAAMVADTALTVEAAARDDDNDDDEDNQTCYERFTPFYARCTNATYNTLIIIN